MSYPQVPEPFTGEEYSGRREPGGQRCMCREWGQDCHVGGGPGRRGREQMEGKLKSKGS